MRIGDWIKLHCGDHIRRKSDPRHTGRVVRISNSVNVRVIWDHTSWIEDLSIDEVERA